MGLLLRLRGEAAPRLLYQPGANQSYELTAANVAEVKLTEELLDGANYYLGAAVARRLLGDLAYRSEALEDALAEAGILLVTERSRQHGERQQEVEIAFASLKREFRLGETLARTLTVWLPGSRRR